MDKLIVTTIGLITIVLTYWFFFGKKETPMEAKTVWDIRVEGGYKPGTITIPAGKESTLTFTRTDRNSCLEEVVFPDFKTKKFLPINEAVTITLSPATPGSYEMHCGMNMYHGKVVAV